MNGFSSNLLDDLERRLPNEAWPIQPRDRSTESEEKRQQHFLALMRKSAPRVLVYANVNAARRTRWEAAKALREGLRAGVPDLTLVWTCGVAWIEFKDGDGKPSAAQEDMLNFLFRAEQPCCVARTGEWAMRWLHGIGAPVPLLGETASRVA